ncbi:hypothetical protein BV898_06104 [Hypsibius exemplaris]|uniref:Uncharacterized protein n=1 Tax=Hypsibius exemplaris TaxID=2072580 RepID=A0A1W0WXG0_HYPEX|nr:hypothetical protein BV898_06104 [Hypsibius exemplaris]
MVCPADFAYRDCPPMQKLPHLPRTSPATATAAPPPSKPVPAPRTSQSTVATGAPPPSRPSQAAAKRMSASAAVPSVALPEPGPTTDGGSTSPLPTEAENTDTEGETSYSDAESTDP